MHFVNDLGAMTFLADQTQPSVCEFCKEGARILPYSMWIEKVRNKMREDEGGGDEDC